MRSRITALAAAGAALALPAAASAHVTVQPKTAAAGAYTVLNVRVPNERDNASTTRVQLQLPPGFVSASYEAQPGWTVEVAKKRLSTPVQTDDGPVNEGVDTITWTGTGKGTGAIAPGQFRDFPISVKIPDEAGDVLTFKALQTYSNGEVVRWIGAPDADEPAPQLNVTAADAAAHGSTGTAATPAAPQEPASDGEDGGGNGLAIVALIVGALGLLAGAAALLTRRRVTV